MNSELTAEEHLAKRLRENGVLTVDFEIDDDQSLIEKPRGQALDQSVVSSRFLRICLITSTTTKTSA